MSEILKSISYSKGQLSMLVTLRVLIGWHFLYEGFTKLANPDWSSIGFLLDSKGPFAGLFQGLANNPGMLNVVDFLNVYGLIAIGFGLILGALSRPAIIAGMVLLAVYYLSHPPFVGISYAAPAEGKYLWVNKNLIEMIALAVLYVFPTSRIIGMDRLFFGSADN